MHTGEIWVGVESFSGDLYTRRWQFGRLRCEALEADRIDGERDVERDPRMGGAMAFSLKAGKLRHRTLTPEQAELMRLAIANYRRMKRLLRDWEVQRCKLSAQ